MTVVINKWGHSLGLRIPKDLAQKNDIQEGTEIEFLETPDGILIRKKQKKMTFEELVAGIPDDYDMEDLIPDTLPSEEW